MKINYILSDTTKGATTAALQNVINRAESNLFNDYVVIVPETKSIIIEKELLALSKNGAFANIYVYSFVRLINRLGFVPAEKTMSKQICILLLRKIIYDNYENLKCYKKTAKTIGFAEKMYETISQFKSSGVSVEDLKLSLATKAEALKAKLEDIVLLYEEYEKVLGEDHYDDLDKLSLISKFAKSNEFISGSEIFVVGFDNITYEMVSVLKDLATHSKEITFSCVYFNENREDKHIQTNELYSKFKRIAEELKYPYVPTFVKTKKSGDFYNIQNYLFAKKQKTATSKGQVEIFEAKTKKQEIDALASKIVFEVESGKKYRDIGVFACDLDASKDLIKEVFGEYNIPYFINESHDISSHFFVKFIIGAFELVHSKCSAEKVLNFISNPIWKNDDYSLFYKYIQETGVSYESMLEFEDVAIYSDSINKKLKKIIDRLKDFYFEFKEKLKNCVKFKDFVTEIYYLFEKFDVKNKLEEIAGYEKQYGNLVEAEIIGQLFEKQERFNNAGISFMGELELSLEEFIQIYFTGFSSMKLNVSPVSIDCVIVQDNTDGFFGIKDMFIIGAEEGKFPVKIDDSGIILDREIEETISIIGKPVEPTVKEINKRESFRVYEAFLEPQEKLFVSYSLNACDGKASKPARAVLRLDKLFGTKLIQKTYTKPDFVGFENYSKKFAKDINKFLNGEEVTRAELNKEYSKIHNHLGYYFKNYLENLSFSQNDFILKNANGLYFYGDKTSVSQLEKYFSCPYLFFATYGLRLKENKNAKLSSLDVGTIIHRVAELFIYEVKTLQNSTDEVFKNKVKSLLNQAVEESKIIVQKNQAILGVILTECLRLCESIFIEQSNSSFKHKVSEWSFEGENAISLNLSNGNVIRIEGKIDRIDEYSNYVRVIDYKTGGIDSEFTSIYFGTKIQLISYVSAITKLDGKKVAGVFYLPVHSDYATDEKMLKDMYKMEGFLLDDISVALKMDATLSLEKKESNVVPFKIKEDKHKGYDFSGTHSHNLSEKDFENTKVYTEKLCSGAIEEILSGYIEPSPIASTASKGLARCSYCKLKGFCGLEKSKFKFGRVCSSKVNVSSFDLDKKEEVEDEQRV